MRKRSTDFGQIPRAASSSAVRMMDMSFRDLPASAAWRHEAARIGFESVFPVRSDVGYRLSGHTAAVEGDQAWVVQYVISLDDAWLTRSAQISGWSEQGRREVLLESDGSGRWRIDGHRAPELDGCLDVDLESSACTNTLPVHRLGLSIGREAESPAVYVRALDLSVERLAQRYARVEDSGGSRQYDYEAPAFDFETRLIYDTAGLVIRYPGIARRVL
jgi:hypothetical protein